MSEDIKNVHTEAKTFSELKKGDLFFTRNKGTALVQKYVFEKIKNDNGINKMYSSTCGGFWIIDNLESCVDDKFGAIVTTNRCLVYQ